MNIKKLKSLDTSGEILADFGLQPVSNRFLPADRSQKSPMFPMSLRVSPESGLIHLSKPFPIQDLKPQYYWLTCFEPEAHLDAMVEKILTLPGITKNSRFGAYSFKDDSTLTRIQNKGYTDTWRIDPEADLNVHDKCANVETYQFSFTPENTEKMKKKYGVSDVFIIRHVVEHSYNIAEFVAAARNLIDENGYIVWELPDCQRALESGDWTTLWEEHIFYFTSSTFKNLLYSAGFEIVHFESVPYMLENSLIAIVKLSGEFDRPHTPDSGEVALELQRAFDFAKTLENRKATIRAKLEKIKREKGSIAMFGAGHLSIAFLSIAGLADLIDFVIDDNPHKKGLLMPIGDLEIVGSDVLYSKDIRFCLLSLNPQNQPKVIANHAKFIANGGIFASIFPGGENDLALI